ncbi:hypothetical protein [Pseudomonas sp. 18175]|uniref:hypothetical protein n=1 Tax=Pseudomonas sp. 18175 TaxID=3390056 RepID=UPI003D1DF675
MTAGICGLDEKLVESYDDVIYGYSSFWSRSVYSFDTGSLFAGEVGKHFYLGKIGGVEIFDNYPTIDSLEDSKPKKVIKSSSGCANLGMVVGFLVFEDANKPVLKYLDLLRSEDPIFLQRMGEEDLKKMAVGKCNI